MTAGFVLRVLGGVEVAGETPGPLLERKLLAILTVHRNWAVPSDQLIDSMWNGKPPAAAGPSLQSKMSRIRPRFGSTGLGLAHEGHGYVLTVPVGTCDVDVFERLANAFIQGGVGAPLHFAEEALDLWRGRPYGEFADEEWAQAEAARLEQLRDSVATHRVRVLVTMRRCEEALVHGEALQIGLPFSDDVCALRMQALSGLGRNVEALRAFDRFRRQLIEETGVNPGAELLALYQDILGVTESPLIEVRPATARQRLSTGSFYGRSRILAETIGKLAREALVTVVGEGGIGKTRFAVEATRRTDRVVWCDIELTRSEPELLRTLASAVGFHPTEPVDFTVLAERLAAPGTIVVFDGCEFGFDLARRVIEELRGQATVRFLATSRRPLELFDEVVVRLRPLPATSPRGAAVALLVDRAGAVGIALDPHDPLVRGLAVRLDGHPLAIELVASRLAMMSLDHVVDALDGQVGWSHSIAAAGPRRSLRDAVGLSYSTLDDAGQRLFRAMSVFSGPTSVAVIRQLVGRLAGAPGVIDSTGQAAGSEAIPDPMGTLLDLAKRSLVHVTDDGSGILRYRVLNPLADIGRCLADQHDELLRLRRHHTIVMVDLVEQAVAATPGPGEAAAALAVDGELANLRAAYRACDENGWFDLSAQMVAGLSNESRLRERAEVEEWAMDLAAHPDIRLSSHAAQVMAMAAHAHLIRARFPQAIRMALSANRAIVDGALPTWSADCVLFQTSVMEQFGEFDARALQHHRAMYAYTETTNDAMGAATAAFAYAYICADMGRPGEGIAEALYCLRLGRRTHSPTIEAMGIYGLARLRPDQTKAIARLQLAMHLAESARCDILARQAARALLMISETTDLAPALERLRARSATGQSEQVHQEIAGLLIPMVRAGEADLAAMVCGALTRTIWWPTAAVRAAEEHLREHLSPGELTRLRAVGRQWTPDEMVDHILRLAPAAPNTDDEGD